MIQPLELRVTPLTRILAIGTIGASALFCTGNALGLNTLNSNQEQRSFEHVSCQNKPNEIRLTVSNVAQEIGLMTADLYSRNTEYFLKSEGRISQVKFAAKAPITQFCLYAPSPGEYSIAVYHDKNANNKLDKGAFGIPAEPWGLSRDPKIRFRAPPIEKTLFSVPPDGASITLRLRKR